MTFPGYFHEHILPDRLENISLSFLVDGMTRQRGGIGPNIAYTLALLGGDAHLLSTVGEDFADYRNWLESQGVHTEDAKVIAGTFTASFFCNTDRNNAQIASFFPARWRSREASRCTTRDAGRIWSSSRPLPRTPCASSCKRVPRAGDPLRLRSRPAAGAHHGRRAARGRGRRLDADRQRL